MNPTLGYFWHRLGSAWATSAPAMRALARIERTGGHSRDGQAPRGLDALRLRAAAVRNMPYYVAHTITALVLALLTGAAAAALALQSEPGPWSLPAAGLLGLLCGVCLYEAIGRRHGPAFISPERFLQAQVALRDSGDAHSKPMPVLLVVAMAALFLIDGAFAGYTLTSTAFGSLFTPRVAMFASFAWSCAIAWLLFHLTSAAALEGVINRRRDAIRHLLASPRPEDQQRATAMIAHVGQALGHDYSRDANRWRARVALWAVVIGLSVATLVVRVSTEQRDMQATDAVETEASDAFD